MLESELFDQLTQWAGLAALVGSALYPLRAPPNTPAPYVVYSRTDTQADDTLDSKGLPVAEFSFDCYGATYAEAKTIAAQIRAAVKSWSDDPPQAVMSAAVTDDFDGFDETAGLPVVSVDVEVLHRA